MLEQCDMREDVQEIFIKTKHNKQVCMFSATMTEESRGICKKFMRSPLEIFIDDQKKLTLHGLVQYYSNLLEKDKTKTLLSLLYKLNYNQTIIFCKSIERAKFLNEILIKMDLPSIAIHRKMTQEDRIEKYKEFKEFKKRILVATNILARGIDIERVNVVFNYDMPEDSDTYLHRVGRAGRFGTKGLAITFVSTEEETKTLNDIQARFAIEIKTLPDSIDQTVYRNN
jgi:ATP-dependent RNA helicase UAP56/SUB2